MDKKIVWGTCWLNESVENLVEFFKLSIRSLSRIGFDTLPIIFDANYTHNDKNINYIKKILIMLLLFKTR